MSSKSTYLILGIILAFGLFMRLTSINDISYSNDELSALNRTQFDDLGTMIQEGVIAVDYHPAATQILLYSWVKAFGMEEWIVRSPFVLFGLITIWLTFLVGRTWGDERTGLIAAALVACLAFPVLYSRLARPYAMGTCFVMASAYFWSLLVKGKEVFSLKHAIGFVAFGVLATWTHYYAGVCLAFMGLSAYLFLPLEKMRSYSLSGLAMVLIAALHWPITHAQLNNEGLGGESGGWLDSPGNGWLNDFFLEAFNGPLVLIGILACTAIGLFLIGSNKKPWRPFTLFFTLFFLNYLFGDLYSEHVSPILQFSGLLFVFPLLVVAISYAIAQLPIPTKGLVPISLAAFVSYTSLATENADPFGMDHFGRFKELAVAFDEWESEHKGNIAFAANVNDPFYLEHYFERDKDLLVEITKDREDLIDLREALEKTTVDHFAFCWSTIQMPAEVYALVHQYFPFITEKVSYFNSEAVLFSRKAPANDLSAERFPLNLKFDLKEDSSGHFMLTPEYSPNLIVRVQDMKNLSKTQRPFVHFALEVNAVDGKNPVLVMDWKRKNETIHWSGAELREFHSSNGWKRFVHVQQMPEDAQMDDELRMYVWNRGEGPIQLRSIRTWLQSEL